MMKLILLIVRRYHHMMMMMMSTKLSTKRNAYVFENFQERFVVVRQMSMDYLLDRRRGHRNLS